MTCPRYRLGCACSRCLVRYHVEHANSCTYALGEMGRSALAATAALRGVAAGVREGATAVAAPAGEALDRSRGPVHLEGPWAGVAMCGERISRPASPGREKCVVCADFARRDWSAR